jgi:AraC-like DNA-binding protein
MRSCRYTPAAPLAQFVNCFWYWEGVPHPHRKEKLLPNGEASIVFNLRERPIRIYDARDLNRYSSYGSAVLSGARANFFVIDSDQQECVLGIQFRPGGAFPFFRIPASEVEGLSVNLDDLWGVAARSIRDELLAAPNVECMFQLLERRLLEQLCRPMALHAAVDFALGEFQGQAHDGKVSSVTERIGMSSRRFIELFRREVGLTPKVFCRVRRFQRVLRMVHEKSQVDWLDVALGCGYYDQAHFIHDFQAFAGLTPSDYLLAAPPHLNHLPLS